MTLFEEQKDLVVLVADGAMKSIIEILLNRCESMGIRSISSDVPSPPGYKYDSGVFGQGHEFLRSQQRRYRYAISMCDRHGCGRDLADREELERAMVERLEANGWNGRAAAIVIDPELEIWAWANSPHVARVLGWSDPELRAWLADKGFLLAGQSKPVKPKEAWNQALRMSKKPRSNALFEGLAQRVTLAGCVDPAFGKLKATLQRWFPA